MIELKSFDGDYNENIDVFKIILKVLGKEEEGKKCLEEYDKKIEEYKKEIIMDKN